MKILALIFSFFALSFNPIHNSEYQKITKTEHDIKGSKSFARFLSHFDKVDIPDDIDHAKLQEYKSTYLGSQRSALSRNSNVQNDMKEFILDPAVSKFSRMGPPLVVPLDRFYTDEKTLAVTYLVRHPFTFSGFNIVLSLFDFKGNKKLNISNSKTELQSIVLNSGFNKSKTKSKSKKNNSITIAGFDRDNTILCSFNNPGSINVDSYKNNWLKDVAEFGIGDNTIANYDRLKSDAITINPNGKIDIKKVQPSFASLK